MVAYSDERTITIRETMKSLESRLDEKRFVRVHRSALINVDRLCCFEGANLVMTNGDRVACSRSGKKILKQLLSLSTPT